MLLSAIPGTAVVWVKVAGAVPVLSGLGRREDLANLLLNLKKMVVRVAGNADTGARLGAGPPGGDSADFAGDGIEIVTRTPRHGGGEGKLALEIGIRGGLGYVSADRHGDSIPAGPSGSRGVLADRRVNYWSRCRGSATSPTTRNSS